MEKQRQAISFAETLAALIRLFDGAESADRDQINASLEKVVAVAVRAGDIERVAAFHAAISAKEKR